MRRVRLPLAPGLEVEFADRERALQQVLEWAERGTRFPVVVFGPEGCGKTAWLKQAAELLKDEGYEVFYLHPLDNLVYAEVSIPSVKEAFLELAQKAFAEEAPGRVVWAIFNFVRELLKAKKAKVAVLADDVFQVIGLNQAAAYVKGLLNMIEHPIYSYENIVVLVATSEGVSRGEIGRHRWASLTPMWNMSREGFAELYRQVPEPKPSFEEAWRVTGGNPGMLAQLYEVGWRPEKVVEALAERKKLAAFLPSLSPEEREWLRQAVEDPDTLFVRERIPLMEKLVELNLIVDSVYKREDWLWIDEPPPEKDPDLGIGRRVAWQSPLHREAVRRALEELA
jgi:energy-coupling factor transporter ATP-binding protein EcfA2